MLIVPHWTHPFLAGSIFHDVKRRWPDGRLIRTSYLTTPPDAVRDGAIVSTLNSKYLLKGSGELVLPQGPGRTSHVTKRIDRWR